MQDYLMVYHMLLGASMMGAVMSVLVAVSELIKRHKEFKQLKESKENEV